MGMPAPSEVEATPVHNTVSCKFPNTERTYTYKYDPTILGRTLQVGDRVIVDTPKNGPTEVTVSDLHAVPMKEDKFKFKEILSWVNPEHEV